MGRARRVSSALLLASLASLVPAACAAGHPPVRAAQAGCTPAGAHTLAADRVARVFSWRGSVYGCAGATGQRRKLGGAFICNLPAGRVAPVRLAGPVVAYAVESCGVDTAFSTVFVLDLASGKRLADLAAATPPLRPESFVSVRSLVLRRDGAVGWIAEVNSIGASRAIYQVHRFERRMSSQLDSGTGIGASSLGLVGARMTWRHGSATRSAGLS